MKIYLEIPDALMHEFVQMMHDFDLQHHDQRFTMIIETDLSVEDVEARVDGVRRSTRQ